MSAMGLIIANCNVTVTFHGDKTYDGPLAGLKEWAKTNDVSAMRRCVSGSFRHGLFPCIIAASGRVAAALSVYSGYKVAMGDGRSFFTRKDALACYAALHKAGVPVTAESLVWAISETPYDIAVETKQPELPLGQTSIQQQHAEAPF